MRNYINNDGNEYNSFIYQWIDIKSNKFYIGSHYGSINDGYLFGGIDIKKEYKERPNDFKREILSYHLVSEYSEIRKIEKEYLIKNDVENNDFFYNRTNQSYGGYHKKSVERRLNDIDENGLNHFQRSSLKMVKTRKENGSYKTSKVKEYITKNDIMSDIKNKISKTLMGRKWINKDGEIKYVNEEEFVRYLKDGWSDGLKYNISYDECKRIAIDNNIKSASEWYKYSSELDLPTHPERKYKEWINWNNFLDKEIINYISYDECKKIAIDNNIKSSSDWKKLTKYIKNIPSDPNRKYKEWVNWYKFLEKERK